MGANIFAANFLGRLFFAFRFGPKIRFPAVDQIASADRFAAEQHSKTHFESRCERQIDRPRLTMPIDRGFDHKSFVGLAIAAPDGSHVGDQGIALDFEGFVSLDRVDLETDAAGLVLAAVGLDIVGMNRARPGTGIDLGLDRANVQTRHPNPFAPPDNGRQFLRIFWLGNHIWHGPIGP